MFVLLAPLYLLNPSAGFTSWLIILLYGTKHASWFFFGQNCFWRLWHT